MSNLEELPNDSLLLNCVKVDYFDSFVYEIESNKVINADDIQVKFWTVMPKWVDWLFKLRNILVKPFGLTTEQSSNDEFAQSIRNGQPYKMCSTQKTEHETVLCLKDKHLIAYLSIYVQNIGSMQRVIASTLVNFQNSFGRIYLYMILPFHLIIMKIMLKSSVSKVLADKNSC